MSPPVASHAESSRERLLLRALARADRRLERAAGTSRRFTHWRLVIFLAGAAATVIPYKLGWFHLGNAMLGVFLLMFLIVARYHNRLELRMHRLRAWREIKRASLARLRLDWKEIPERRIAEAEPHHPYAADLDLVGHHSVLTLLDTTVSSHGWDRLRSWLLDQDRRPLPPDEWTARQALIRELAPLRLFRDRLILEASLIDRAEIDGTRLRIALESPARFSGLVPVLLAETALAVATLGLAAWAFATGAPDYWTLSFTAYVALYLLASGQLAPVFGRALSLHGEMEKLDAVFRFLETRSYAMTPALRRAVAPLTTGADRPSQYVRGVRRVTQALSVRANPIAHVVLNGLGPWDLFHTYRLERMRIRLSRRLPAWLDALAEVEAASAVAAFADLNPDYCWPIRLPAASGSGRNGRPAQIVGRRMAHPLLPPGHRVANDLDLRDIGRILLITGSNMSGKSTFLRTVGLNVCLAQAGAPVCAAAFEWTWVRIYCCIRVDDSLEEGLSFFYAEVKRLKELLDAAMDRSAPPVLFLIDEIFKGTNNRERLIGSRAYIRALAHSNGFGLVTTHDLELTDLERDIPGATNLHFQETVEEKTLKFDYRLRPGPCPTTNALRIMELQGLPVPHSLAREKPTDDQPTGSGAPTPPTGHGG